MAIKGILFDLDRCVLDTSTLGEHVLDPVFVPLVRHGVSAALQQAMRTAMRTQPILVAAAAVGLPPAVAREMDRAYRTLPVPPGIRTYGDEHCLRALPTTNILVTTGYRRFQSEKIEQLGVAALFAEVVIDELDDLAVRLGKQRIFAALLARYAWTPADVLVVGDNPDAELAAGRALGIRTVQTLRPGVPYAADADHHVASFCELAAYVEWH